MRKLLNILASFLLSIIVLSLMLDSSYAKSGDLLSLPISKEIKIPPYPKPEQIREVFPPEKDSENIFSQKSESLSNSQQGSLMSSAAFSQYVSVGTFSSNIGNGELQGWYFNPPPGTRTIAINLYWYNYWNNLDLYLWDPNGNLVAQSTQVGTTSETIFYSSGADDMSGTWILGVYGTSVSGRENYYGFVSALVNIQMDVEEIIFNHDTSNSNSDSLNIRKNYSTDIVSGSSEWVKGGVNNPAAYEKNKSVTIKAKLTVYPITVYNAKIRAISLDQNGSLGDVVEKDVTFVGGTSYDTVSGGSYITFSVSGTTPDCIKKTTTDQWQWAASDVNGWYNIDMDLNTSGPHTIYTISSTPYSPWSTSPNDTKKPWTDVLDYACDWASGETDESDAVIEITEMAYTDLGKTYDGSRSHSTSSDTVFQLTNFLGDNWADCRDMSATVHLFTRVVGIGGTYCRKIYGQFLTKSILPVGNQNWTTTTWNFHQVAIFPSQSDYVYDSCLELDPSGPRIPTGEAINGTYKNDLFNAGYWTPQSQFTYTNFY